MQSKRLLVYCLYNVRDCGIRVHVEYKQSARLLVNGICEIYDYGLIIYTKCVIDGKCYMQNAGL